VTAPARRRTAGVLVVGSANIDLSVAVARLPGPGETVTQGVLHCGFGGKGANQAVAARRAGARVALAAALGADDHGERYLQHLRREGIDISAVRQLRGTATGTALICVDTAGRNQIAVASGANARLRPSHLRPALAALEPGDALVAQFEVPVETVVAAFRAGRRISAVTVLNTAPFLPVPRSLATATDVVVMNEVEAGTLCDAPVTGVAAAHRATAMAREMGFSSVVITLGKRGAVWRSGCGRGRAHAPRVSAVDTVGAGDTFVGYLAAGLARGQPLPLAVEIVVHASAVAVTRRGAQSGIPRRRDLAGAGSISSRTARHRPRSGKQPVEADE
jgi:ribokinase